MTKRLRATYRMIGFILITVGLLLLFCLGILFCLFNKKRKVALKNWLINRWASAISRLIGLSINIVGDTPKPPFFLISNHLSYIDILPFWKHLKTTFIAKSEISDWPLIGQAASLLGIIYIDRTNRKDINRVNTLIEEAITDRQGVILFPEGTSSKGQKVLPFKSSLLYYPASQNMPVYFASISYQIEGQSSKKAWKDVCWWGDMDFLGHFWGLLKIKSFTATVRFGPEPFLNKNRKMLAQSLHQKVADSFIPTYKK